MLELSQALQNILINIIKNLVEMAFNTWKQLMKYSKKMETIKKQIHINARNKKKM